MARKPKYKHSTQSVLPEDGAKEISRNVWNEGPDEVGMTGHGIVTTLIISSGAIIPVNDMHIVAGEGVADDDLTTITNTEANEFDEIRLFAGSQTITVKNGVNNIITLTGSDSVLSQNVSKLFIRKGTNWYETGDSGGDSGTLTRKFIAPETWNALSGLTSEQIKVIHINNSLVGNGTISVIVDGTQVLQVPRAIVDTSLVIFPSSSISVISATVGNGVFRVLNAGFLRSFSISAQETSSTGMTFNNDGSKMYIVGSTNNTIYEYNLTTNFDISTASFFQSFSVSAQDTNTEGMAWNNDGSKMYTVGNFGDDINEYNLTTNFDISTASFFQSFSVSAQTIQPHGMAWNNDGSKMYVIETINSRVYEYNLTTNFDISTASFFQFFSVSTQDSIPTDVTFNNDGSKMYVVGIQNGTIYEYNLTTNFDISTTSFFQSLSVVSEEGQPHGMVWNNDGSKMYIIGPLSNSVHSYNVTFGDVSRVVIV